MHTVFLISLSAVIGAKLRYLLARSVTRLVDSSFRWGTLAINLSASFILGLFLTWTMACRRRATVALLHRDRFLRNLFHVLNRLRDFCIV